MDAQFRDALDEVGSALAQIDTIAVQTACDLIADAGCVGLFGCGREGLQLRGFAMRLYHLGLNSAYLGEMNTPPLGSGDLLVACAGPGELATVRTMMQTARDAGAQILFITAQPHTPSAKLASHIIEIPAQTMADDDGSTGLLPMGSAFEGALFFLFEIMIDRLKTSLGIDAQAMANRHTNME